MTHPNPLLAKLSLAPDAWAVIFHADDIGMCHASLAAYQDLVLAAAISSAGVMVPCPWYAATAALQETEDEFVDSEMRALPAGGLRIIYERGVAAGGGLFQNPRHWLE